MKGTDSNDSADEGAFAVASNKYRINSGDSQGNEKAPAKRANPI